MYKVCIFEMVSHGHDYYGDEQLSIIASSVTEWQEVTQEEFVLLRQHLPANYRLVAFPQNQKDIVINTVKKGIEFARKKKEEEEKAKLEAERKKTERALKKKAKTEAEEKALLAKLNEKYGGTNGR